MINNIKTLIKNKKLIKENEVVWVAFSGGADSTCLLHVLNSISKEENFIVKACHINHMLRGEDADKDQAFCQKFCVDNKIEFRYYKIDVMKFVKENNTTVEEGARIVRYNIFKELEGDKIALGHNYNDNAETVLMNILRGTSLEGLCGINIINNRLIRPLINTSRKEIEQYNNLNNLNNITDASNQDNMYFRNKIRNEVIPFLNKESGKNTTEKLNKMSKLLNKDMEYINNVVNEMFFDFVKIKENKAYINNKKIANVHESLRMRIIRKAIKEIKGNLKDIEAVHTELLNNMCLNNTTGEIVNLPDKISGIVQFDKTIIYKEEKQMDFKYDIIIPSVRYIEEKDITIETFYVEEIVNTSPKENIHYFAANDLNGCFELRNKRDGDLIVPYKGNGKKKLKKYFIDRKIDRFKRNGLFLLAKGKDIIYIQEMEYNKKYLPQISSNNICIKIVKGGKDV